MASSDATLYSIAPWRPFAHDLAAGLRARHPDPLELARLLLILPTRRAARAVTEAFVALSDGKALLLPRMAPAGDMDADEALGSFAEELDAPADLLPEIAPLSRRLILACILTGDRTAAEALTMADQLGRALDTLEIEGRRVDEIDGGVPPESADHWERNRRILQTLQGAWPAILKDRGVMDLSARRNRLLRLLAARWRRTPPPHPVVMAGFASAPPAVAELAGIVARAPHGMLILPGIDADLDDACWERIGAGLETHPQFGMARLLATARLSRREAVEWPHAAPVVSAHPARATLASRAMLPAELGGERIVPAAPQALAGVRMVEAAGAAEEALLIAVAMRQVLEHPGRRAALVTPDRQLARRVQVQLRRFGIEVDDSAGQPLPETAPGSLLIQLAAAASERFAPVALLGLLQHPLARAGDGRLGWLNESRRLDRHALRGLRPAAGLRGIGARLARAPDDLKRWWDDVAALLAPLEPLPGDARALLAAVRGVAEAMAGQALWAGEAGRALARLLEGLDVDADTLAGLRLRPADAAAFLHGLLAGESVRPRWGRHPQLHIWGPLEARLQHADLMILGGLNEGSWPGIAAPDPFLPPAIRRALDLPGLARRTGMQAHDFASALAAPEVLLTRAARQGGAPQVASRFWQRLAAAAGGLPDCDGLIPSGAALLESARGLMRPRADIRIPQPQPSPPADTRPRRLSVTDVAMLKADPFSFYAKRMLRLQPLDPRDAEPTGGERGQAVHDILERHFGGDPKPLATIIDEELAKLGDRPEIAALWRPRVLRMVDFAVAQARADAEWTPISNEAKGQINVSGIELHGRADRVDRHADGELRIVDYKTGQLPAVGDVESLWQTQLGLLAALAEAGRLKQVPPSAVRSMLYVKLTGGAREEGRLREALGQRAGSADVSAHIADAWHDMETLVERYLLGDAPFTAKLFPVRGRNWRDYDLLARVAEWLGR